MWTTPHDFKPTKRNYLTATFKRQELKRLQTAQAEGQVDRGMYRWLRRVNELEGACSLFCCTGHKNNADLYYDGYICVAVDQTTHERLLKAIKPKHRIVRYPHCDIGSKFRLRWAFYWQPGDKERAMPVVLKWLKG